MNEISNQIFIINLLFTSLVYLSITGFSYLYVKLARKLNLLMHQKIVDYGYKACIFSLLSSVVIWFIYVAYSLIMKTNAIIFPMIAFSLILLTATIIVALVFTKKIRLTYNRKEIISLVMIQIVSGLIVIISCCLRRDVQEIHILSEALLPSLIGNIMILTVTLVFKNIVFKVRVFTKRNKEIYYTGIWTVIISFITLLMGSAIFGYTNLKYIYVEYHLLILLFYLSGFVLILFPVLIAYSYLKISGVIR